MTFFLLIFSVYKFRGKGSSQKISAISCSICIEKPNQRLETGCFIAFIFQHSALRNGNQNEIVLFLCT